MKDLYSPHPTKPDLWLHRGRYDDIIVFSTGEKINPLTMEGIICMHPDVRRALVVGQGRFQSALLVEPKAKIKTAKEREALLNRIWPFVERANQSCPPHGQIFRGFVLFTSPEKPMLRASKGTVQRMSTVGQYEVELDVLYGKIGQHDGSAGSEGLDLTDGHSLLSLSSHYYLTFTGYEQLQR